MQGFRAGSGMEGGGVKMKTQMLFILCIRDPQPLFNYPHQERGVIMEAVMDTPQTHSTQGC